MRHIYYVKTPAGMEVMNLQGEGLAARERQIMLMCTEHRPVLVLVELFGDGVVRELHELVVRGYLQAMRRMPDASAAAADAAPAVPPFALNRAQVRLQYARDFINVVARSLDSAEATKLLTTHGRAALPDEVLAYAVALIELLFRAGDPARTVRVGYKIADLLPRPMVPQLVDGLLEDANPELAAALYDHLLSGRDVSSFDDSTL